MLDRIIGFSLRNKYLILISTLVLTVIGLRTVSNMDIDVFPDLTAPTVVVMTDAHGMAAEEVERLVTFPIETAVNGATDVRRVRSVSAQGFSFVWVEFDWGVDVLKARQVVSEKLIAVAQQMPLGVSQPMLAPQSSVMGEIFFIGLQADSTSMMELRTIAEWTVKPLILATGGVSQVTIIGGDYKQYQVVANPTRMLHLGVNMHELANACRFISMNSNGVNIREFGNEYVVRGIARTSDIEQLGQTLVATRNGMPVKISDIAEIRIAPAPKMGYASSNTSPAIILSISKQPNINTLEVTRKIEANLENLRKSLPPDVKLNTKIFRQSDFIERSVGNVQQALIEGAIFVTIILLLFLGSFRTTIISLLAIPISLLATFVVMKLLGININTMSLGGMAIAIGSLVDDAIIDVENVYKRLRQNREKPEHERQSSFTVVYEASREIRASILNATLIIIVAFVPLFFLSGMEGRMLKPLGISFIVSLFMSLLVAMTLTPVLARMLLTGENYLKQNENEKWLAAKLRKGYEKSLQWVLRRKRLVLGSTLTLLVFSVILLFGMGRSFLPEFNEGSLTLSVVTPPGTSLDETNKVGNYIEKMLLAVPEVTSTARRTGRGELDEHSQATNSSEIDVNFQLKERSNDEFLADVRASLARIPGIAVTVGQPLGHRIDHMLTGTRASIAIKLFGDDLTKLYTLANQIKTEIVGINGLVDVNVEQQVEVPQIQIRANRALLAEYGISLEEFNEFVDIVLGGEKLADIYEGQQRFDLVVKLDSTYTSTIEGIKSILIDSPTHGKVPLYLVADVISTTGPNTISRENVQRKLVISANVAGRDLRGVVNDIRSRVDESITFPEGYRVEYGGQFESEARASRTLLIASLISILIIFMLLFVEFRNFSLAGIILLNLPLALIGGVFAIWLSSGVLSIPAIIGFISLFGIATRNGILLISNYIRFRKMGFDVQEVVVKGSSDRLNAILMTALTAALALIPLAFKGHLSGNEIQSPMAKVILGGLLTSTFLNIYIIPIVYTMFDKNEIVSDYDNQE
ncbi:efflux RND transporter permease subunit [Tenuifilum sp.]|mgnify:FL=1|uniref:efflux RND transporter permease subunit n=1 Tax=Tenuifilum sp. TaxID=2760880 RepID=UPI002CFE3949|nr:efflux RND transporter permease subunit [Tenuifilum sp.]HQE54554.1 efflux RND transporter permease subunit [Tenuifilum sp.]HQG72474.1 efflux RND transporter permease subunit [Tenuifilum sp.]HQI89893.1 efflux RND transporter permease subunit [Tenuifilum sp.]